MLGIDDEIGGEEADACTVESHGATGAFSFNGMRARQASYCSLTGTVAYFAL